MIRAFSFSVIRYLIAASFIVAAMAFGIMGMAPTAFARSYPNQITSEITAVKEEQRSEFITIAQRDRKKRRGKKRRKARGFTNQQSDNAVSSGRAASLGTVARRVRRRVPGQLLDARLMKNRRGNLIYRLKILSRNGVMRDVTADAYSGAILGVR